MEDFFLDALTFSFPHAKQPFFEGLCLHFPAGKLNFIQGKNGSGKSTLFRLLQGKSVKTVVQNIDDMLADQFTVEQNLQCANLLPYPGLRALPSSKNFHLLHEFGIKMTQQVCYLSGGQRQILAIIMALQKSTKVLLLDEPTAALDPKNTTMIMEFLSQLALKQGLVVVIISHDMELVNTYCSGVNYELYQDESGIRRARLLS